MLSWGFGVVLVFVLVGALGLLCFGVLPKNMLGTLAVLLKVLTRINNPKIAGVVLLPLISNSPEILVLLNIAAAEQRCR